MKNSLQKVTARSFEFITQYLQRYMQITKDEVELLLKYCELRYFDKKEIILKEGETDNYLSMVVNGLVRKYIRVKKAEVILQLATEGHIVHSETSFLTRAPSMVELETLEPTTILSIRYDMMQEVLEKHPNGEKLSRLILNRMYIKKDDRKHDRATKTMKERFLEYVTNHPHMLQRVPQKYLASYLNISPETFSRLKHLLKEKK
jgi:CRP-like cAMP-binding protein